MLPTFSLFFCPLPHSNIFFPPAVFFLCFLHQILFSTFPNQKKKVLFFRGGGGTCRVHLSSLSSEDSNCSTSLENYRSSLPPPLWEFHLMSICKCCTITFYFSLVLLLFNMLFDFSITCDGEGFFCSLKEKILSVQFNFHCNLQEKIS